MSPLFVAVALVTGGPVAAPDAAPVAALELRAALGHDALAGQLARGRRHGAQIGIGLTAWPEGWRAGALLDDYHLGVGVELGWRARVPDGAEAVRDPYDVAPNGYLYGALEVGLLSDVEQLGLRYTIGATGDAAHPDVPYGLLEEYGGWPNVAEGEIAQNLYLSWRRSWLAAARVAPGAHLVDLFTTARTALGERRVSQEVSITLRTGWLRGRLPASRALDGPQGGLASAEAYVFGRVGLDVVAHDAMIDGPFFNDRPHPHEVNSRPLVPVAAVGVSVSPIRAVQVGFALELRGAEVDLPPGAPAAAPPSHVLGHLEAAARF